MSSHKIDPFLNANLLDKILEQGQRLRNSIVQSILNNDPFNGEIMASTSRLASNTTEVYDVKSDLLVKNQIEAYLQGEYMSPQAEQEVLAAVQKMTAAELCKATERTYSSYKSCSCQTCKMYTNENLSCDLKRSAVYCATKNAEVPPINLTEKNDYPNTNGNFNVVELIKNTYRSQSENYLKYVDSMQIIVHNLTLTDAGVRKIYADEINKKSKLQVSMNCTYFVEYAVPNSLQKGSSAKSASTTNKNCVRICSRKMHSNDVSFKQISVHDVANLNAIDVQKFQIDFIVSSRTLKQKNVNILGTAVYNLSSLLASKHLTSSERLILYLKEESPIIMGTLKVTVKLGCGKLYFGKDFVDALVLNKENSLRLLVDSVGSTCSDDSNGQNRQTVRNEVVAPLCSNQFFETVNQPVKNIVDNNNSKPVSLNRKHVNKKVVKAEEVPLRRKEKAVQTTTNDNRPKILSIYQQITKSDKQVLFGFFCVSEAQYNSIIDSYLTCRPFCIGETVSSKVIYNTSNPIFNFFQLIPLVYEDELLLQIRENYVVVEFWKKRTDKDQIFGITKLPLYQFYVAYRNPVIVKHLLKNTLPVINTDWWETIDDLSGKSVGQVQVLLALGSEEQINYLKTERGFKKDIVTSKFQYLPPNVNRNINKTEPAIPDNSADRKQKVLYKIASEQNNREKHNVKQLSEKKPEEQIKTTDIGIQSVMDLPQSSNKSPQEHTQLSSAKILPQKSTALENSTILQNTSKKDLNIEEQSITDLSKKSAEATNLQFRKTSDLLNSLEEALILPPSKVQFNTREENKDSFRVHIVVENALHLPSRKKCKPKKSKGKNFKKHEDILPSTYVTFETLPGEELKMTCVAQRNINPRWDYRCDVSLPIEFLTNSQKRLIFKVWRKSNNSNSEPCLQTDVVLGFAALDLTVLLAGLPTVQGWFNITDFSNKCNGQIKIQVTPLENVNKYYNLKETHLLEQNNTVHNTHNELMITQTESVKFDESSELLSRALKRKFTELDEITRRLRLRLSNVTNDESDVLNDDLADEFERDINTLCVEDDYDMINLQIETDNYDVHPDVEIGLLQLQKGDSSKEKTVSASKQKNACNSLMLDAPTSRSNVSLCEKLNTETVNSLTSLDKHLVEGKQRIDTLLEKLSLLSASEAENPFENRYVSGCSVNREPEHTADILKELGIESGSQLNTESLFNSAMFQQIYTTDSTESSQPFIGESESSSSVTKLAGGFRSDCSLLTDVSDQRMAPDGAGNPADDKTVKNNTP